jgi:valyl-tRNA synthetase
MSKLSLNGTLGDRPEKTARILDAVLRKILLLLHPITPFVTEEIWQGLDGTQDGAASKKPSIMIQPYPVPEPAWIDTEAEEKMGFLIDVVRAIRNLRSEINCPPGKEVRIVLLGDKEYIGTLKEQEPYLRVLARLSSIEYGTEGPKGALTAVVGSIQIYLPLDSAINLDDEAARLAKEVSKVEAELQRVRHKLSSADFLAKAKEEVVQREKEKSQELEQKKATLGRSLDRIRELQAAAG